MKKDVAEILKKSDYISPYYTRGNGEEPEMILKSFITKNGREAVKIVLADGGEELPFYINRDGFESLAIIAMDKKTGNIFYMRPEWN